MAKLTPYFDLTDEERETLSECNVYTRVAIPEELIAGDFLHIVYTDTATLVCTLGEMDGGCEWKFIGRVSPEDCLAEYIEAQEEV